MLSILAGTRIFLTVGPTDMRKGFKGLSAIIREEFQADPTVQSFFVVRGYEFGVAPSRIF